MRCFIAAASKRVAVVCDRRTMAFMFEDSLHTVQHGVEVSHT
jgi:hypothetical protein